MEGMVSLLLLLLLLRLLVVILIVNYTLHYSAQLK